jgi:PAP2 superfamily
MTDLPPNRVCRSKGDGTMPIRLRLSPAMPWASHGLRGLLACALFLLMTPLAHADAVTDWNGIAVQYVSAGRSGAPGVLDLALVQTAVHDAVQAFEHRFEPYYSVPKPSGPGSLSAAVAAAAHGVLVGLYPGQQAALDAAYDAYIDGLTDSEALVAVGEAVGQQAAADLLTQYRAEPDPPLPSYTGGNEPGEWRPTDPSFLPGAFESLASMVPFTVNDPSQFRPKPPPPLTSIAYLREYNEVKSLGAIDSTTRTPEQTDLARFWSVNFIAQWNEAIRGIAVGHIFAVGDSARLFALANLAAADAAITVWDSKYFFSFWRPITAIRNGDDDGNPRTVGEADWTPLLITPPYPDYTSGANGLTGAFTTILQLFFKTDEFDFAVPSTASDLSVNPRLFNRFSDAAEEVVEARILQGIHFRSADKEARRQGRRVALWTFTRVLRPARGMH